MGFSTQEYWSGLPCPSPGNLPNPLNPVLLSPMHWQVSSLPLAPPGKLPMWVSLKCQGTGRDKVGTSDRQFHHLSSSRSYWSSFSSAAVGSWASRHLSVLPDLQLLLLSHFSRVQLCTDPIDSSPPGSSVPGILQARILEWVAISFFNACIHAC